MYIVRFLGGVFALILAFFISMFTKIDLISIMAIMAFILTVDSLVCKFISYVYMKAIYQDMENIKNKKDKENGDDSSN